jgi:hypothetical protein
MSIGIVGAGLIGAAFARRLAQANISAILSNSRGPDSLADLVADIGGSIRAGTRDEAAAQDLVLVAVTWSKLPIALRDLPDFRGRIVIDANNPIEAPSFQPADSPRPAIDRDVRRLCAGSPGGEGLQSPAGGALGRKSARRRWPARAVLRRGYANALAGFRRIAMEEQIFREGPAQGNMKLPRPSQ